MLTGIKVLKKNLYLKIFLHLVIEKEENSRRRPTFQHPAHSIPARSANITSLDMEHGNFNRTESHPEREPSKVMVLILDGNSKLRYARKEQYLLFDLFKEYD